MIVDSVFNIAYDAYKLIQEDVRMAQTTLTVRISGTLSDFVATSVG